MRTAHDLQTEERLDMAELAEALVAVRITPYWQGGEGGFIHAVSWALPEDGMVFQMVDERLASESPNLLVILRDAVRKVAPGSYCIPVPTFDARELRTPPLRVRLADEWGHWPPRMNPAKLWIKQYREVPHTLFGATETECWARAIVALHRAGLLGGGA